MGKLFANFRIPANLGRMGPFGGLQVGCRAAEAERSGTGRGLLLGTLHREKSKGQKRNRKGGRG